MATTHRKRRTMAVCYCVVAANTDYLLLMPVSGCLGFDGISRSLNRSATGLTNDAGMDSSTTVNHDHL